NIAIAPAANAAAVLAAINGSAGGVTPTLSASNPLVLPSNTTDTNIAIGGATAPALLGELGLAVGTSNATNLLTQGIVATGQTMTIDVNPPAPAAPVNPTLTITFGTGVGQISTLAELATA